MMQKTLLLLEDDISLNETITEFLQEKDYFVISVYDGEEAEDKIYENQVHLLLLDVNVPFLNGFELLKKLRANGDETPAIFITSMDSVDDVEKGFLSGGNDYIRKPFSLKELLLRIENLLKNDKTLRYQINNFCYFDTQNHILHVKDEQICLNNKEAILLEFFLQNQNKILHHEEIFKTLWSYNETPSDQALRTYIKNLRKYLGKDSIVSIKKLGYKFTS